VFCGPRVKCPRTLISFQQRKRSVAWDQISILFGQEDCGTSSSERREEAGGRVALGPGGGDSGTSLGSGRRLLALIS